MNRNSLEIAVHPDKTVLVKAPISASIEEIQQRMQKRARWIQKQITYFKQFEPHITTRQYVGGESHLYLGRKYRLKIEKSTYDKVLLKNGYFYITCLDDKPSYVKRILDDWYKKRTKIYLASLFDDCWKSFDKKELQQPILKLQKMEKRWGSLSVNMRLTLNVNLIQAPKECIEYVIFHELCHLIHHNHSANFYKLLNRTMPDWMKRKHKLEMSLSSI